MKYRTFILFLFMLFLCSITSYAAHVNLPFNARYNVLVNDGDTLFVSDFPNGWGYNAVVLGMNASQGGTLSGKIGVGSCLHNISGDYQEVVFKYEGSVGIRYFGPTQTIGFHWWVEGDKPYSSCDEVVPVSHEDSVAVEVEAAIDSIEKVLEQDYLILESMDVPYTFEGNETFLKIKNLPTFAFNMINVQIEPLDNKELKGLAYAGNGLLELQGWTETLQLQVTSLREPVFKIIFPENRKVKFKWWVSVEAPVAKTISSTVTNISSDSAEVVYDFSNEGVFATNKSLKIKYAKSQFKNGALPTVKKYDIFPSEVSQILDKQSFVGDFYDVHAEAKEGEEITVSIPISWNYEEDADSIYIAHYLASEHR